MGKFVIIGLCGAAGAGKSTAAEYLADRYGFERLRFADPLKAMLRAYYRTLELHPDKVEMRIEGELKTEDDPLLCGRSPQHAMQTLGTKWGRNLMSPSLWTAAWSLRVRYAQAQGTPGVVVEDVRFPYEAVALRVAGGRLVEILRPGHGGVRGGVEGHTSEGQPLSPDTKVYNLGADHHLGPAVESALRGHTRGEWL